MNPPGLTFQRTLRAATDVNIIFTPRSTGQEVVQPMGHVFVLSDLFLACERIAPEERPGGDGGPDMWLSYPPLAGKHLKVVELPGDGARACRSTSRARSTDVMAQRTHSRSS